MLPPNDKIVNHLQWGFEIQPFEILKHLKLGLFEGWILNSLVFKLSGFSYGYSYSPNHLKTRPFEIWEFLSGFLKWLGFRISDTIQNLDHLVPNLFWTI